MTQVGANPTIEPMSYQHVFIQRYKALGRGLIIGRVVFNQISIKPLVEVRFATHPS